MECTALKYSDMLCKAGFRFITLPENENRCVVCGEIIPEGLQACPVCCAKMDDDRVYVVIDMRFARKLKRKDKNKTNCCGEQMDEIDGEE